MPAMGPPLPEIHSVNGCKHDRTHDGDRQQDRPALVLIEREPPPSIMNCRVRGANRWENGGFGHHVLMVAESNPWENFTLF